MKLITEMVALRDGKHVMREVYCSWRSCSNFGWYKKTIPITQKPGRCPVCHGTLNSRWLVIGDSLDYTDYFSEKGAKRMRRGK